MFLCVCVCVCVCIFSLLLHSPSIADPGGGVLAMLGYPGMCHFLGYTFCPKFLKQDILFAEKF